MAIIFEQLPLVYQVETLIHVKYYGERGFQTPYTYQTLEKDFKQEALRIWQEEKYEQGNIDNVLRNLSLENDRRGEVRFVFERLLQYKKSSKFGDVDHLYRDFKITNDIYKRQLDNNLELFNLTFFNQPYSFNQLKREIARLKYQELAPQVRKEKEKFGELIINTKTKAGNFEKVVDLLLEAHQKVSRLTKSKPPNEKNYAAKSKLIKKF